MNPKIILALTTLCISLHALSQEENDSVSVLREIVVRSFEQRRNLSTSTATVRFIEYSEANQHNKISLVNAMNTIAGVRMEERSPGSYRINIRGSSLRSPFGVRNVKVYWEGIPLTDPGGNTYFNQLAYNNLASVEIFKGPVGSLYGAGTGGLILINSPSRWEHGVSAEFIGGSFNTYSFLGSARFGTSDNRNQVTYAHNESDGYRIQSAMRRDNISWISQIKLSDRQQLSGLLLFTDMYYQTPGALTLTEYANNPKGARPAAGAFPSAVNARAAIHQKNLLAGINNEYAFSPSFKNNTVLYGAFAQVRNPAIRNHERRNEPHFGGRTFFTWNKKTTDKNWQLIAGSEYQQGYFNIQVADNRSGNPDTLRTNDDVNNLTYNFFVQGDAEIDDSWFITAGISLNAASVKITRLSVYPVRSQSRKFSNEWAPRIALLKQWENDLSLRFTVSRGFSPPTTAEVLPSTGVISTELEAEHGWNFETTLRKTFLDERLQIDLTGFYFKLQNALVQRRDLSGADFFVNSGGVEQKGVELHADYIHQCRSRSIDYVKLKGAYTLSHFEYGNFIKGTEDFSGKRVPSVPEHAISFTGDLFLNVGGFLSLSFYSASDIFLNDANTMRAKRYHLMDGRAGWKKTFNQKIRLSLYVGANNIFDERYSLGNDINAPAGRFYNAAPERNFYAGVAFQWLKPSRN